MLVESFSGVPSVARAVKGTLKVAGKGTIREKTSFGAIAAEISVVKYWKAMVFSKA